MGQRPTDDAASHQHSEPVAKTPPDLGHTGQSADTTAACPWNLSATRPPVPVLDAEALQDLHLDDDGPLPPSYVSFVKTYGWGRLFGLWLVYPPVPHGYADGLTNRGQVLTDRLRESFAEGQTQGFDWMIKPDGSAPHVPSLGGGSWEVAQHLTVFAQSENGDCLAWDTGSRSVDGELPIYRSARFDTLSLVGRDLYEVMGWLRKYDTWLRQQGAVYAVHPADFEPLDLVRLSSAD